mgnify:FL=1|jgi:hypothetical protein
MSKYKDYTREQLIAMLEESNDIVDAVSSFLGASVVADLYMNHRSEEE